MVVRWSFVGVLLGVCLCTSAHASTILFSTLGNTGDSPKSVSSGVAAESFVATSNGIGDVELALSAPAGSNGNILITVMSDSNDRPSTVVDTIATFSETNINNAEGIYDFYNLPINNLVAGNRYWIETGKSVSDSTSVYTTIIGPSTGTASNSLSNGATNYYASAGRGANSPLEAMCVSSDNACDATYSSIAFAVNVPEPATVVLFGPGVLGLGFCRRRTK